MSSWWKKRLLFLAVAGMASPLWAQTETPRTSKDAINPFASNYVFYEYAAGRTVYKTKDHFKAEGAEHGIGFRHNINESWFMGLTAHQRRLRRLSDDLALPFLVLSHESLYVLRLYHPIYLFTGPRLFMFLPLDKKLTLPIDKSPLYDSEVGAGWLASVVYCFSEKLLLSANLERWRGTKTDRFHGVEAGVALHVKLP